MVFGSPFSAESKIYEIIAQGGYTPQQRALLSAAMSRQLGMQAEQAGQGLGRRFAAQGIAGTGLANAALGQIQSGLLSALQQGEEGINRQGLDLYLNALQSATGIEEAEKARRFAAEQAARERRARLWMGIISSLGSAAKNLPFLKGS